MIPGEAKALLGRRKLRRSRENITSLLLSLLSLREQLYRRTEVLEEEIQDTIRDAVLIRQAKYDGAVVAARQADEEERCSTFSPCKAHPSIRRKRSNRVFLRQDAIWQIVVGKHNCSLRVRL